jgi:hypothetical protein
LEQFCQLSPKNRKEILRGCVVQEQPIRYDEVEDILNSHNIPDVFLRQECYVGTNEKALQVIEESREMYYGVIHFSVPLHYLDEFIDTLQRLPPMIKVPSIASLVGRITVNVDLHDASNRRHIYDQELPITDEYGINERCGEGLLAAWTKKHLKKLLKFTNVKQITVALRGGGLFRRQ